MAKTRRQTQVELRSLQPPPLPDSFIASIGDRTGAYNAGGNNIYVRELASGQTIVVKNTAVPNRPGRLVKVERLNGTLYVVGYWGIYGQADNDEGYVPDHSHRWPDPNFTPVEAAAIMPFNILPYDGFEVQIFGGIFQKADGTFGLLANQIFDLSGYQPSTGAEIVHFQCDEDGVVSVVEGTEVDVKELLTVASIPAATETSLHMGVRLYAGQEAVRRDGKINDFFDWRLSFQAVVDRALDADAIDGYPVDCTPGPSSEGPTDGQVLTYDEYYDAWIPSDAGAGDMLKSVYDTDNDGVVDAAEDAIAIDGILVDNTTTPPTDGQVLIFDYASQTYIPGDQSGGGNTDLTPAYQRSWFL